MHEPDIYKSLAKDKITLDELILEYQTIQNLIPLVEGIKFVDRSVNWQLIVKLFLVILLGLSWYFFY